MNHVGLENLIYHVSIHPIVIQQYEALGVNTSLIQLLCDEEETPFDVEFTKECCGMVLEMVKYENRPPTFQVRRFQSINQYFSL